MFIFHKLIYKSNAFAIKKGKENENQQGEGTPMLRLPIGVAARVGVFAGLVTKVLGFSSLEIWERLPATCAG